MNNEINTNQVPYHHIDALDPGAIILDNSNEDSYELVQVEKTDDGCYVHLTNGEKLIKVLYEDLFYGTHRYTQDTIYFVS